MRLYNSNGKKTKAFQKLIKGFREKYKSYIEKCPEFNFEINALSSLEPTIVKEALQKNNFAFLVEFYELNLETSKDEKIICKELKNLWAVYLIRLLKLKIGSPFGLKGDFRDA